MPYSELDPAAATVEVPIKGAINSSTVRNVLYMIMVFVCDTLNQQTPAIVEFVVGLTPPMLQGAVPFIIQALITALFGLFGYKAIKGRTDVGDIKGMYKNTKPS